MEHVLSQGPGRYGQERWRSFVESIVLSGNADRDLARFIFSKPPFVNNSDPLKVFKKSSLSYLLDIAFVAAYS